MDTPKPIGYWLKHLHNLLERHFDATLAGLDLSRRHWQILSTLSRGARTREDLRQAVAPFWSDGDPNLDEVLDGPEGLATRGWMYQRDADATVVLTDEGRAAHAALATRIHETRMTLLGDLTSEQYTETLRILSVMADNVEADLKRRVKAFAHRGHVISGDRARR